MGTFGVKRASDEYFCSSTIGREVLRVFSVSSFQPVYLDTSSSRFCAPHYL